MPLQTGRAEPVWTEHRLVNRRFFRNRNSPELTDVTERAKQFKLACERLGGLYSAYARFLAGRIDLLPTVYQSELRYTSVPLLKELSDESRMTLDRQFPDAVELGNSLYSTYFRITYQDQPVILEAFSETSKPNRIAAWKSFCKDIRLLVDSPEAPITHPNAINEFFTWLSLHTDVERKRQMLDTLQEVPDHCVSRFPRLVNQLQSENFIAYEELDGQSLSARLSTDRVSAKDFQPFLEALLEQPLFLSVINTEVDPENLLALPGHKIGLKLCPALESIPPTHHSSFLNYFTSILAGDQTRASRMLVRIICAQGGVLSEEMIRKELSKMKVEPTGSMPDSLSDLRDQWRALSATDTSIPFFLQIFHRTMMLTGESHKTYTPSDDLVIETVYSVVGRLIRFHSSEVLTGERAQEWALGTGLLTLGVIRQLSNFMEQIRDNDLTITVNTEVPIEPPSGSTAGNIGWILLVAFFLVALQVSLKFPDSSLGTVSSLLAAASGIGFMVMILRIR